MIERYEWGNQERLNAVSFLRTKYSDSLPVYVSSMGDFACDSRYFTKRKGLEQCLILYTLDGQGHVKYEGREYTILPDQIMILDCRKYHYYGTQGDHWHFLWIHFGGKSAYDYVDMLNEVEGNPISFGREVFIPNYYEEIYSQEVVMDLRLELRIGMIIQQLLGSLICLKRKEEFIRGYEERQPELKESIFYIQKHYMENLTVESLAKQCHMSKYHYIRVFKSFTGQPPYDYLLSFRLLQSQRLLIESRKSIETIAVETGFSDKKNFVACFKKRIGITPSQFRKKNSW